MKNIEKPSTNNAVNAVESFEFEEHPAFLPEHLARISQEVIGKYYDEGADPEKYGDAWQEVRNEAGKLADYFIKMLEDPETHADAIKHLKYFIDSAAQASANQTAKLMDKGLLRPPSSASKERRIQ